MHLASPFPKENPRHENELIKPAVDGTLNVLRACHSAGTVKRVVLTSSVAAIASDFSNGGDYTETNWTDTKNLASVYVKSKTLAERAAWDYHGQLPEDQRFELAVINPSYVIGPVLCGSPGTSMELPKRLLEHGMPMVPHINLCYVDVRDVAAAHVAAMTVPEAAGNRHITSTGNMWFVDVAKLAEKEFKPQGYNIPTTVSPYAFLWLYGRLDKTTRLLLPSVGKVNNMDNSRMRNVLGIQPRDVRESFIEMCYSMIEQGFIKKTSKYTGQKRESVHL